MPEPPWIPWTIFLPHPDPYKKAPQNGDQPTAVLSIKERENESQYVCTVIL